MMHGVLFRPWNVRSVLCPQRTHPPLTTRPPPNYPPNKTTRASNKLVNAVGDIYQEIEIRSAVALGGGGATACSMKLLALVRFSHV